MMGGSASNAARVVAAMRPDFKACYQAALAEDRNVEGSVRILIKVAADGSVSNVTPTPRSLPQGVVDCVLRRAYQAKFDPPEGGAAVIAVPITFVRDNPSQ
jgi:TonB family protein